MITLIEATSKPDIKRFIKFPFALYKDSPYWVPPILKDEMETFDRTKNPAFHLADARFFMAQRKGETVGRVAVIINKMEVEKQKVRKVRFGWMDFVDDGEVSRALFDKIAEIGKRHDLDHMEGPLGFSNLDKVGVLTEGFGHMGSMVSWYNYPYYKEHYEAYGLLKEKGYVETKFKISDANPALFVKMNELVKKRYGLREINCTKTSQVIERADAMFELLDKTYSVLASYVPISQVQREYFKKKYISFISPEYIKFIVDKNNKMVAFAVVMPSFARALQRAGGKLFPWGLFHLLRAKRNHKDVLFYLIGIDPEYQNKGLTAIIFNEYYKTFKERGIENGLRTPELEDNEAIRKIWKHFSPEVFKRRCTYRKALG